MAYATFEYYRDTFLGNVIQEADFDRLSLRASEYIGKRNEPKLVRLVAEELAELRGISIEEVEKATCAVAEKIQAQESKAEVTSESVGSYSVTYKTSTTTYDQELVKLLKLYLGNTGLLYRGR